VPVPNRTDTHPRRVFVKVLASGAPPNTTPQKPQYMNAVPLAPIARTPALSNRMSVFGSRLCPQPGHFGATSGPPIWPAQVPIEHNPEGQPNIRLPTCALCGQEFHLGSRCATPIPEGRRNDSLFRVAVRLCRWGGRWFTSERVEDYLLTENERRCVPPLADAEVVGIARSAFSTVHRGPRRIV
jgi:Primase C terminal 1 (PriCT-1)